MAQCKAKARNGKPCNVPALKGGRYCFTHEPAKRRARAEAHRKGGERNRTPHYGDPKIIPAALATPADAKAILSYTLAEVLPMENSVTRARVLLAVYEALVKSFEIGELEARIAALETRTT